MSFDPYIHFQGNCRAAMTAYQAIFGGDLQLMPYSEAPDGAPEMKSSDRIMHGALTSGGRMLLASDFPPGFEGDPQKAMTISRRALG